MLSWLETAAAIVMAALAAVSSAQGQGSMPADVRAVIEDAAWESFAGQEQQDAASAQEPDISEVYLDMSWEFADFTVINSGAAVLYRSQADERKNITVGVNAGHGTDGGGAQYVYSHPDLSPKVTGGSTAYGSVQAMAVASGMTFNDGSEERTVTLREAQMLKELLLSEGYDVLMLRDGEDVQLDNIARTVLCNNLADCHIAIHWDGDGLDYDKGCYYMAVPDALKGMYPVSEIWQEDDRLGECLIAGLASEGLQLFESGSMQIDLVQTSFSKVPSVDVELGNQSSSTSDGELMRRAYGLLAGIDIYFGYR